MTCWCDSPEVLPTDFAVDVCENCDEVVDYSMEEL